ncbi:MAG TPA: DUF4388 domain-containing protein [Vicinamibacteria bacterium]|nr:DUF4388 domain-containing protein [Vicinamibacteria bacterium]
MRTAVASPLTEVLLNAGSRGESGGLAFSNGTTTKRVYFRNGNVVFASSDVAEERLGERLVRAGKLTRAELDYACRLRASSNIRLGATLVKMGYLTADDLDRRVRQQVTSIVHSLLEWPSGTYRVEPELAPLDSDLERGDLSTRKLLLEGVRRVSDANRVRELLGDLDSVVPQTDAARGVDPALELTPEEGFVLSRVDGESSVAEIANLSPLGEDQTLRCIYALFVAGLLEIDWNVRPAEDREPPAPAPPPEPSLPPELVRFRDEMIAKHQHSKEATHYELLEVSAQASKDEIKAKYFTLAKKLHPDHRTSLNLDDPEGALDDLYLRVKEAYEVLSNDGERRRYDFSLQQRAGIGRGPSRKNEERNIAKATYDPLEAAILHYANGERFFHQQRFHEAIEELKNAVRLDDSRADYHRLLARALARNPKWKKQAEEHFQLALRLNKLDPLTYVDLGELYESSGLTTRARKMYENAVSLDPDNQRAHERLRALRGETSTGGKLWSRLRGKLRP